MPRKPKKTTLKQQQHSGPQRVETIEEYLARGGKVTVCPPGMRSDDVTYKHTYGRKRKKKEQQHVLEILGAILIANLVLSAFQCLTFWTNCSTITVHNKERKLMYSNTQQLYAAFAATPVQQRYAFLVEHNTYNLTYNINWLNCAAYWKQYAA